MEQTSLEPCIKPDIGLVGKAISWSNPYCIEATGEPNLTSPKSAVRQTLLDPACFRRQILWINEP